MRHTKASWGKKRQRKKTSDLYRLSAKETVFVFLLHLLMVCGVSRLFYDSFWAVPVLAGGAVYLFKRGCKELQKKKKLKACSEFRELLESMSANLYAGVSLENSFMRGVESLRELYGSQIVMLPALEEGIGRLKLNMPMERVLCLLSEAADIEDMRSFAALAATAQKNGGNLIQIIGQSCSHISEKMQTDQEIATLISAKRMEQQIMCCMPFGMMLYMRLSSPGYFDVLYHNAFGIVFMSICLLCIFAAYVMGKYIIDITI